MTPDQVQQAISMYVNDMMSLPRIGKSFGIAASLVRYWLIKSGVKMRTRAEGNRLDGPRRSAATKGKPRPPFSDEWKRNISESKKDWAEKNAKGTRITSSGYVEYTRGPHKGRSVHVVAMEKHIGRHLLDDECVHHIDEDKKNNDISNLMLMTTAEHIRHHRLQDVLRGNDRERNEHGQFC
jgi:hypothetical protein